MSTKSEMNKIRTLSAKEAAEYTKETGKKIPHLTSTLILIIFFFVLIIVITLGASGVGKSSLIDT